jgi:hypothetical protein
VYDREFESREELGIVLFTTAFRPAVEPTQPPIQRIPGALSLGVKRLWLGADNLPPPSAEVKNAGSYTSTPQYAFMAWCSVKAQGQIYPLKDANIGTARNFQVVFRYCVSVIFN